MEVVKSKITGYCHGVEKTISNALYVLKEAEKHGLNAYSIGDLIHNADVVAGFERQGLRVIKDADVKPGVALVRAHGLADKKKQEFIDKGFTLVDSTCLNIVKTQGAVFNADKEGRIIIVVGIENHDEANTLLGTSEAEKYLVSSVADVEVLTNQIPSDTKVAVAVQTTFPEKEYADVSKKLKKYFTDIVFLNRLCGACLARKSNGLKLAMSCEAIFVVGGVHSSNTRELADWIKQSGKPVYFVENVLSFTPEFDNEIKHYKKVGVCSGTSTPSAVIDYVCHHLEKL